MRNAGSRFADSTRRAVTVAVALTCTGLALWTSSASADFTHGSVDYEFGLTGKPTSTFGSVGSLAFQQASERLYVLGHESISAFDVASPGAPTPLPAPFPIIEHPDCCGVDIAVDNSSGPTSGNFYWAPTGYRVEGWSPSGEPLPGFQSFQFETGSANDGIAIDNEGKFFIGKSFSESVGVWGSGGGGQSDEISTSASVGRVSSVAIDPTNNDLWVSSSNFPKVAHYTAASGYKTFTELSVNTGPESLLAINASRNVIYVSAAPYQAGHNRRLQHPTGQLIDSFSVPDYIRGLAVQESTDTLFVAGYSGKVLELPPIPVPKSTTGEPIADATVSGTADPDGTGEITGCFFEFGTSTSYGSTQACDQAPPFASVTQVTATLPGLIPETPYHYRLVLINANGQKVGVDSTITSHYVKGLRTDPANGLGRTTATLHAHFEGTNEETHYHFEWASAGGTYQSTPDEVKPAGSGNIPLTVPLTGLVADTTYHYRVVASNELGSSVAQEMTFRTSPAVEDLATKPATAITATTATLNGTLNPDGLATTYYFQYGRNTAYGLTVPAAPGLPVGSTTPVDTEVGAEVTNLEPGTVYHYRTVAINSFGTTEATDDQTFSTAQAPSIISFTSRNVSEGGAELVARIEPNEASTEYHFEYGTTPDYGSEAPVPAGSIPAGATAEVAVPLNGLEATTYHFRVVATSKWGTTVTGDQTFNFFPPQCPNAHLREQTGASYLPDCRAYELVSPGNAGNVPLSPRAPFAPDATSPSRFAFTGSFGVIEGTGEPEANISDLYVASRQPTGWTTKYVGIPVSLKSKSSGPPNEQSFDLGNIRANADLSRFLVWDGGETSVGAVLKGSYAPFLRTVDGTGLGRLPTNVSEVVGGESDLTEGGFVGDVEVSKDFTHFVFSSRNVAFAADGLTAAPGSVYDNDIEAGTVKVISMTPQDTPIPQDAGDAEEYVEIPGISADGSHVLMSTKGPGGNTHLYMTVDDTKHFDVSEGKDGLNHAVKYLGMTNDGATVYFASSEQLTADDHDNSTDLFVWKEGSPATVSRISAGSGTSGNSDTCSAHWTSGCNAVPIETGVKSDNTIASDSGDVYFYSPELLDGARGALGERNLYVFANGRVSFVATLSGSGVVNRIQISPNGDYMALITRAKLTSALTGGHLEMYTFDSTSGRVLCVSCPSNGASPAHDVEGSQNGLFMTNDGRTFFSTADGLVDQDTNGLTDTYEFVDSRPQLISSGTAARTEETGFVGVSANGVDAYFSTLDSLVEQDRIGPFLKFYDARSGGGIPFEPAIAPCAAADECHGPEPGAPAELPATTGASLGAGGNLRSEQRPHKKKRRKEETSKKAQWAAEGSEKRGGAPWLVR